MRRRTRVIEDIEILDFAAEGKCLAKENGEVIFVNGANVAPGDRVKLLVQQSKKKYAEAIVLAHLAYSEDRAKPFCEHFGTCGGCKWQHIPYEKQAALKQQQVADQLSRLGKIDVTGMQPILKSGRVDFYRNKLEYSFSEDRWFTKAEIDSGVELSKNALGFHAPGRFDKVIDIDKCWLQSEVSNKIRNFVRQWAKQKGYTYYNHRVHEGFMRSMMVRSSAAGLMVVIQFAKPNMEAITETLDQLKENFPEITSLNYIINQKKNDSFFDLEVHCVHGQPYIIEEMEGLQFRVQAKSFYQTNSTQAYELYKITRQLADIQPTDIVYDLYTGTGTIAQFVAKNAQKVIGVEYIEAAIEDAKANAELNDIKNVAFFAGDMKKVFTEAFIAEHGRPQVVITDPPRAGMDTEVIEVLKLIKADRIVYVSCNPATQARDVQLLSDYYEVCAIQPVDMFPQTHHVENVILLKLK